MDGQEVAFVQGKNADKLRVRNVGVLKVAGFISIDIDDKRALEHSRHTIREAGIGNLIDRTVHRTGSSIVRAARQSRGSRSSSSTAGRAIASRRSTPRSCRSSTRTGA